MKNLLSLFVLSILLYSPTIFARDIVVALSPYQSPQSATAQVKYLVPFLTALNGGDRVIFINGYDLHTLGSFIVPTDQKYQSAKARLAKNRTVMANLMRFAKAANVPSGEHAPSVIGALRLPHLLRHIARTLVRDERLEVIVLGSPFYDDPSDPAFSMAQGHVPNDGHLNSSRKTTPYGASDHSQALKHIALSLGFGSESIMRNDQHRFTLHRFWSLYLSLQGGILSHFTADHAALINAVYSGVSSSPDAFEVDNITTPVMIQITSKAASTPLFEAPPIKTALSAEQIKHANNVRLALAWDCESCDLDLYAQPFERADILYFKKPNSAQGAFWKLFDDTGSSRSFEMIEFTAPIDLRRLKILVNFFKGQVSVPVKVKLVLEVDGQAFHHDFEIKAARGNNGLKAMSALKTGQSSAAQNQLINPLDMVGL